MAIPRSALIVELLMSADRVITAAQAAPAPTDPNAWRPAVILGHLSQVDEQVWIPRLALMTTSTGDVVPSFGWWEPDALETAARFAQTAVDDSAALLLASRTRLLHSLRDLTDAQWSATAQHAVFGELDVEGLVIQALGHDEEHRATLLLVGAD